MLILLYQQEREVNKMSFIQVLMLLLILSANGIVIPNSAWYCLIAWAVIIFIQDIKNIIKNEREVK